MPASQREGLQHVLCVCPVMMVESCNQSLFGTVQGCFLQLTHWVLADSYIIKLGNLVSFLNGTLFYSASRMCLAVPLVSCVCMLLYGG